MKSRFTREILNSGAAVLIALILAASAFTARAEALLKPTVSFTGAPATASNGSTFSVTATTNDGTTATITATATSSCTVPAGSTGGTVTVTMTKNSGACSLKASWLATKTYLAATLTQKTTATLGYTESNIYYFGTDFAANGDDGRQPEFNGMVFDTSGNIYASTKYDYNNGSGAIVELSPAGGGTWNEKLLYVFDSHSPTFSGWSPQGSLAMDSKGNIYGTTSRGGGAYNVNTGEYACGSISTYGCGSVYELSPNPDGGLWTLTDLHDFAVNNPNDGIDPMAGVTLASTAGTVLYGTTGGGGTAASGCSTGAGTIYELSKAKSGSWQETILYSFPQDPLNQQGYCPAPNGFDPNAALLLKNGKLFGTTYSGGINASSSNYGIGVLFELSPGSGGWTFNQLYVFCTNPSESGACLDGGWPSPGTVAMDSQSNLYGIASGNVESVVWELPYSSATKSYGNQVQVLYEGGPSNYTGYWLVPYKNSWFFIDSQNIAPYVNSDTFIELTNSTKGWQATTPYQFPPWGSSATLDGGSSQMIVDKNGNFYTMGNFKLNGNYDYDGGIYELSPLP